MEQRIVVGISGATGAILAVKTIRLLVESGFSVDLVISQAGLYTAAHEIGKEYATTKRFIDSLGLGEAVRLHSINDVGASICSGSYPVRGMVIVPTSMSTVAAIAHGLGDNCLRRAADVTIKEKRPLILVPRETPLSTIHLENLLKLSQVGATILPPMPAWYNHPKSVGKVEDEIVGKILDCLGIDHPSFPRWTLTPSQQSHEDCAAH